MGEEQEEEPREEIIEVCSHEWDELDSAYALIQVTKVDNNAVFNTNYGIPSVVEVCKKCGKIRLFSAMVKKQFGWGENK